MTLNNFLQKIKWIKMIREMIFLLPCKLFSKFCLWCSRLSLNGLFYKTGISVKRASTVGPFLSLITLFDSLIKRRTSVLNKHWLRAPKVFLLEKVDCTTDAPTSVNWFCCCCCCCSVVVVVVLLLLLLLFCCCCCFCAREAVLNLVRGSFYTWMIIRYLMSSRMEWYFVCIFKSDHCRLTVSRLAAYTSHSISNPKGLNRYKLLIK